MQLHVFRSVWMLVIFVGIPGEIIFSSYSSYSFVLCFSLSCCSSSRVSPRGEVFRNLNFLFRLPSLLLSFSSSHSRLDLRDQPLLRESPSLSFFRSRTEPNPKQEEEEEEEEEERWGTARWTLWRSVGSGPRSS